SAISAKGDIRYLKSTNAGTSWSSEAVLTSDSNTPFFAYDIDCYTIVGVPGLAADSANMVSAWRKYSNEHIMFSYIGEYG
ncbi:hypothetical protein L0P06_11180, partial [Amedibacillus dolichus]|uniref:hypothetical protein n=1 Tax=Amedibacillus dolichus TaxID=31971 RepID=UPI001EDB497F